MAKPIMTRLASIKEFIDCAAQGLLPNGEYYRLTSASLPLIQVFSLPQDSAIRLSAETVYRHAPKHPETTAKAYATLCLLMVKKGIWIKRADDSFAQGRIIAFLEHRQKIWKMGIKITAQQEIYLTTLFRCEEKHLRKELKRGLILRI